jgi:hypothetical protein
MAKRTTAGVFAVMQKIQTRHQGILRAINIVAFARNPKSALHAKFEWDNSKAAHEYRLWQARELIAVFVTVVHQGHGPVRAFVSLRTDRMIPGGGYRATADVMADAALRKQLLAEALDDADRWKAKYELLTELVPVFKELAKLRLKLAKDAA